MSVNKPIFLTAGGIFAQLANGAIINAGGVQNAGGTFTVNNQGLLFDDGGSTSGGQGLTLQKVYDRSSPASIKLATGKDFTIYDDTNNSLFFRVDAETGKVTITGDLEVLGSSIIIDTVVQDVDHWLISPKSAWTPALRIEPDASGSPFQVNLVEVRNTNGGAPVFVIDKNGNVVISGLINGVDIAQLKADFTAHVTNSPAIKHTAAEISVNGPFVNIGSVTNVQQAITALDALVSGGGGPSAAAAGLFFLDATPTTTGNVANKQYVAGTVPANKVVNQATTDTDNVTVTLFVEGVAAFYSPTVTVTTVPPQVGGPISATLTEDPADKRTFYATAQLTNISVDTVVNATSSNGSSAVMQLLRAPAGPAFTALLIGPYPSGQSAVKAGDVLTITGIVENSATAATLLATGANSAPVALTLGAANSGGVGYKSVSGSFTVGSNTGVQGVQAQASNSFGTLGAVFNSTNTVLLDQLIPVIGPITITYPVGQQGLKGSESATVSATITNATAYLYSGTNLAVAAPTTYAVAKTVTRTGGAYSYGANNYTITATRTANGAVATASAAVTIADAAPTAAITIAGSPPRLRSSPTGNDYTITLTASQRLLSAPALSASSGTWVGSWAGGPTVWTRTLRITDGNPTGPQTFSGLTATGLAGVVGTVITSGANYVVGGFLTRTITFPAFARYAPIGVSVTDFTKTSASYTNSSVLTRYADTADHFQGFSIVNSSGIFSLTGDHLYISDAAFAGANTSGTLQLDISEAA